jgi:type I restriction enzyme S subunit
MKLERSIPCVRLGDHCEVKRGISWDRSCESITGTPALTIPNIQDRLDLSKLTHLSGVPTAHIKKATVRGGHTIMVGSNGNKNRVGDCIYFPHDTDYVFASFLMGIRPLPDSKLDSRYTYYWLKSPAFRTPIQASLIGATSLGNLRINTLRDVMVPAPSLPIQHRIADILATYDDLIENALHRINTLERMARAIYREWFVDFRCLEPRQYPATSSPLDTNLKEWQMTPFRKLVVSMRGGDWGSEQPEEDKSAEVAIVRGTDFDEVAYGGELRVPIRYIKTSSLKSRKLQEGDLIVENSINAKSRCVGSPLLVDAQVLTRLRGDAVAASFCKVFRFHNPNLAPLAYLHLSHLRETGKMQYYQNVAANGIGNFQAQKFAEEEHLALPTNARTCDDLVTRIGSLLEATSLLASRIQNLRRTRDLLLPRLLQGEISL